MHDQIRVHVIDYGRHRSLVARYTDPMGEAMKLDWDDDRSLCVDLSGRRPMFHIQAHAQKSHKEQTLPMAPEFYEMLASVTEEDRTGKVFNPAPKRHGNARLRMDTVSKRISDIGKAASVKVVENSKGKVKFASAHDLRRAFGLRWSARIMPAQLQQLMRHESISTTMEYYVGRNAEATADAIWNALGNNSGNIGQNSPVANQREVSEHSGMQQVKKHARQDSNLGPTD